MRCLYRGIHPCGKCPACLANRQRAFCFRLDQEKESASFYYWLTLTYNEESVPKMKVLQHNRDYEQEPTFPKKMLSSDSQEVEFMCFSKEHCRSFFEKIRKKYSKLGVKFKHFLVSEYGPNGTERPHYHCLLMVYTPFDFVKNVNFRSELLDFILNDCWPYGFITEKTFHGRVLKYLTKYCCKPELIGQFHPMKPFTLISPGIGLNYLDQLSEHKKKQMVRDLDFTVRYGASKIQLPRYYTDKLLPHSKKLLNSLIPDDPGGDWSDYLKLKNIREKITDKQNRLASKNYHVKRSHFVDSFEGDIQLSRNLISEREAAFNNFREQLLKRVDL